MMKEKDKNGVNSKEKDENGRQWMRKIRKRIMDENFKKKKESLRKRKA